MSPEALFDKIAILAEYVVADNRWQDQNDDLGVSVLGMLLYGYALSTGRIIMLLDIEDIDAVVIRCLIERVGVAAKWGGGLVESAAKSAFDQAHHIGNHELIGVGHQYLWEVEISKVVDNVFVNIESVRRRAEA